MQGMLFFMQRFLALLILIVIVGCGGPKTISIPEAAELKKLPTGTHRQTADVPGVGSLNYSINIPSSYNGNAPVALVLALHYGYEGVRPSPFTGEDMIKTFRQGLAGLNPIIIAPDALGGAWTEAQNEQACVWLTKSAMKTYSIDTRKVVITGYSLGGEGTWFIGSRHQDLFTAAIPIAAPVAGEAMWRIPVYIIHSDTDEEIPYSSMKNHAETVKANGAHLEIKTAKGLSHYNTNAYDKYVRDAVRWLQATWK